MIIKNEKYEYLGRYKLPVIYCFLLQNWAKNELAIKYKLPKLSGRTLYLDGHLFFDKKDWEIISFFTRKKVINKNKNFFNNIFNLMGYETRKMLSISKKISKKKIATAKDFKMFFEAMNEMEYPWIFVLPVSDELEKIIYSKLLQYKLPSEYISYFSTMKRKTPIVNQRAEIVKIKKYLIKNDLYKNIVNKSSKEKLNYLKKKNQFIYKKIMKHIEKYQWFGIMHMWGEPFNAEKFFIQLENANIKNTGNKKYQKLPPELKWLMPITKELSYWRNYIAEVCSIASYLVSENLKKSSKELKASYDLTMWLTPQEFLESIKAKKIQARDLIVDRKKSYGMINNGGKISILTGKILKNYIKQNTKTSPTQGSIRGTVACRGKARGIVRLIFSPNELQKIKKGDIFVASETTPDYVPALNIAGAIVTDNGGITSHAAIVSRELNVPCIVGTKIATQVLKNGDFIEVDANLGIVRILKKYEKR